MSKNENIQYVIIKQYDKQLKIDAKIVKNGKMLKTDNSSFISENIICSDAISKLNILQKDIPKTYLASICECIKQKVVVTDEFYQEDEEVCNKYELRNLGSHYSVAILKQNLEEKKQYFEDTGIDYIFSPFNILYNHIMQNSAKSNSLNIFILNNITYLLILNDEKRIVYGAIKPLSSFDKIKKDNFSNDNLDGQKLFDQIHSLEIQTLITNTLDEFYASSEDEIFCEHICLFYTLRQLANEQLNAIKETTMLEIEYSKLNINEYLFEMSQPNHSIKASFISPREKKNKKSFTMWLLGAIITTLIATGILLYIQDIQQKEEQLKIEKEKQAKILAKKLAESKIKLPNHITKNELIVQRILSMFEIIPYSVILSELQLQEKDSTFVCSLLKKEIFEKELKPKLSKIYKKTEILLIQDKKPTFNAIIANSDFVEQKNTTKQIQPKYRKNKFVAINTLKAQLGAFLPKKSIITFKTKKKEKYLTYNFNVSTVFKSPRDFFQFVENLDKKSYSIIVKYPIEFAKTKKGLETTFGITFHQFNKK